MPTTPTAEPNGSSGHEKVTTLTRTSTSTCCDCPRISSTDSHCTSSSCCCEEECCVTCEHEEHASDCLTNHESHTHAHGTHEKQLDQKTSTKGNPTPPAPPPGSWLCCTPPRKPRKRRPCCFSCCCYLSSRACAALIGLVIVIGALLAFFCWPRTPVLGVSRTAVSLQQPQWDSPAGFRSTWLVDIEIDSEQNYVPLQITRLDLLMSDSLTRDVFATSTLEGIEVPARQKSTVTTVFRVNYNASQTTDSTFANLRSACGPALSDHSGNSTNSPLPRPPIRLMIQGVFHIFAFAWTPTVTAVSPSGGFPCPDAAPPTVTRM